ncbi:MAG: IclR family transcriptional regulator [Microbacterium sp.]
MAEDGMLQRTLKLLSSFTDDEPALTVVQLAERTGIPHSTVHRLVKSLVAEGLMVAQPDQRYAVGTRMWELGEMSPVALRLRESALPFMSRLYEETGENVHLAVLDGPHALYVARIVGRYSIETISRAGGRGPLHATGVGKALLATRDEPWLAQFFQTELLPETTQTITDEAALRNDLDRARRDGYATTRGEMTLGNVSFAAPVPRVDGLPPAAIGIVLHTRRADARRHGPLVAQTARDLGEALRDSH